MNSDTPRTDELFMGAAASDEGYWRAVSHARQLERELNEAREREQKWKAMAQEVNEIHIRFNSINKCHHGIRDTATNLPYCRKCDEEGLK